MSPKACWRFATEPRMTLKGTLAADALDLTPYVSTVRVLRAQRARLEPAADRDRRPVGFRSRPAPFGRARQRRDRASSAAPASPPICAAAGSRSRSARRRPIGGVLKGALVLAQDGEAGADIKSQLQFTDVDLEDLPRRAVRHPQARRQGQSDAVGRGDRRQRAGADPHARAARASLTGAAGRASRASTSSNCSSGWSGGRSRSAGDFRRGRTPFERLDASTCGSRSGIASVEDMQARGRRRPPRARRLGLDPGARSRPARAPPRWCRRAPSPAGVRAALRGAGPWDDPIMLPDAQSLIRRSGAAARCSTRCATARPATPCAR